MFITSMKSYTAFLKEDADAVATALAADPEETETFVVTYEPFNPYGLRCSTSREGVKAARARGERVYIIEVFENDEHVGYL